MKFREKLNDLWFRVIGIPVIAYMSHIVFFNEHQGNSDEKFTSWQIYLIAVGEALVLWEVNRLVILYVRNRFPSIQQSPKRIFWQFAGCLLVTILVRYLTILFYDATLFWGYIFSAGAYIYNIFVALLYVMILAGVYEGFYYFQKWKQLVAETEALKRENLQTQLNSLKEQINPHFLFNNLGSLSSLVMEDQEKAVEFINELSSVYRYLLQSNDRNLVTLASELKFIAHYFSLLKTRFGNGIELEVRVAEDHREFQVPPLTLQLLIENAVKHNSVLPERPLQILIESSEDDTLRVKNNLVKKNTFIPSDKKGLFNIREKYRLLGNRTVLVRESEDEFLVSIPLLKPDLYAISAGGR